MSLSINNKVKKSSVVKNFLNTEVQLPYALKMTVGFPGRSNKVLQSGRPKAKEMHSLTNLGPKSFKSRGLHSQKHLGENFQSLQHLMAPDITLL